MAASGYTPIQIYHSTTASAAPTAGNLVNGELAINILDGKLYYKDNGGVVQVIATKGTGTIGGSTTQVQYNNTGALAGSANFTFDGTTATINTLNLTNALGAAYGGTAQSTYAQGDLLYASAANTLAKLPIGISTYILTSNGSIPGWSIPSSVVIGTATNLAGGAAGSVPYQSGAGVTTFLSIGTVNQVVTSTGSAPQWSSGLSITTLTASDAVTFSATTQNIALGTSQTSGTFTVGGAAQTGTQTIDQSTKTHTLNIGAGATESGATKTVNLATAGVSGSTTTMSVGSAVSGAITNLTVNATTTLAPVARSTGAVSYFTVTTPADTGLTASTEVIGSSFTAATRTWATGALTLQRERVFAAPTYAFAGASTLTTAVNVDIGLPVAGTNATITNAYALRAADSLFTGPTIVDVNSASAALRITQVGAGNALLVEDSTNPDSSPFVVTAAGDVGIGTSSPTAPLDVVSNSSAVGISLRGRSADNIGTLCFYTNNGVTNDAQVQMRPSDNEFRILVSGSRFQSFYTNGSERMRLDSSGNLGLGVTPSAWNSSAKAFDISTVGCVVGDAFTTKSVTNAYYNQAGSWTYKTTAGAARFEVERGAFAWYTAPSGTANTTTITNLVSYTIITSGNQTDFGAANNNVGTVFTANASGTLSSGTVSQNISFTQAMTLLANGNLGIGETNPGQKLEILTAAAGSTPAAIFRSPAGVGNTGGLAFYANDTNASARNWYVVANSNSYGDFVIKVGASQGANPTAGNDVATFSSSGNLGLGVTPSAWNTSYKAQEIGVVGNAVIGFGASDIAISSGAYYSSAGWKYSETNSLGASFYEQYNGQHIWYNKTAVAHNAGDSITFTQAMTLDASGNLAFRQASSTTTTIAFQNVAGTQIQRIRYDDSDGSLTVGGGTATAYPLKFFSGNSQAMTLDASGNLGIGTTSPSTFGKLAVYGSGTAPVIANFLGSNSPGSGATYADIVFGARTDGTVTARIRALANDNGNGTDGQLSFWTADDTAGSGALTERARITSGGVFVIKSDGTNASNLANKRTTSVGTSATTISLVSTSYGQLVMVTGIDGGNIFSDLIFTSITAGPTVISAKSVSGTPASRTYTMSGDDLQLAMGSGSYDIRCTQFTNI